MAKSPVDCNFSNSACEAFANHEKYRFVVVPVRHGIPIRRLRFYFVLNIITKFTKYNFVHFGRNESSTACVLSTTVSGEKKSWSVGTISRVKRQHFSSSLNQLPIPSLWPPWSKRLRISNRKAMKHGRRPISVLVRPMSSAPPDRRFIAPNLDSHRSLFHGQYAHRAAASCLQGWQNRIPRRRSYQRLSYVRRPRPFPDRRRDRSVGPIRNPGAFYIDHAGRWIAPALPCRVAEGIPHGRRVRMRLH
jgi:hypothetical protein